MFESAKTSGQGVWAETRSAWRNRFRLGENSATAQHREFLPAALEIQETPPSPGGNLLLWLVLSLFCIGVTWACLGQIDIVVTAPGRIVPNGQVKVVQASETGSVASIGVHDGQRVQRGDLLLRLDTTDVDAARQRIIDQLLTVDIEIQWRQALERWLSSGGLDAAPALATGVPVGRRAANLLSQQRAEITARMENLEAQLQANLAERDSVRAERERARAALAVLSERVEAYKALFDKQYGARSAYLEMLQQQTELAHSIPVFHSRERQLLKLAEAIAAQRSAAGGEIRSQNLMAITGLVAERTDLAQQSVVADRRRQQHLIFAPVTGTVQELSLHTVGGVVTAAQPLLKIVPEAVRLEVEAQLRNKDIGFVTEGQLAEIKVNTFNFTKYGLIDATVTNISNDAVLDEKLGWVFIMRLELHTESIRVAEKDVKLSSGMAVSAEIKTGTRRLIEFFLSPLLRYRQESARER